MANINSTRLAELATIAAEVQKCVALSTKHGLFARSYPNEQPTKEAMRRSIPWAWIGLTDYDEINWVLDTVYPKLRKNGILAKLRG